MSAAVDLFVFDCPSKWCMLTAVPSICPDQLIDPWFLTPHYPVEHAANLSADSHRVEQSESFITHPQRVIAPEAPIRFKPEKTITKLAPTLKTSQHAKLGSKVSQVKTVVAPPMQKPFEKIHPSKRVVNSPMDPPVKKVKQVIVTRSIDRKTSTGAKPKGGMLKGLDNDMVEILRRHNERFTPTAAYEPAMHGMREVRRWEKSTGKIWSQLSIEEKEAANHEIALFKDK